MPIVCQWQCHSHTIGMEAKCSTVAQTGRITAGTAGIGRVSLRKRHGYIKGCGIGKAAEGDTIGETPTK